MFKLYITTLIILFFVQINIHSDQLSNHSHSDKNNYSISIFQPLKNSESFFVNVNFIDLTATKACYYKNKKYDYTSDFDVSHSISISYNLNKKPYSGFIYFESYNFNLKGHHYDSHKITFKTSAINLGGVYNFKLNPKITENWTFINDNLNFYFGAGISFKKGRLKDNLFSKDLDKNQITWFAIIGSKVKIHKNYNWFINNNITINPSKIKFDDYYSIGPIIDLKIGVGYHFNL